MTLVQGHAHGGGLVDVPASGEFIDDGHRRRVLMPSDKI
jgi:hypothetical protein